MGTCASLSLSPGRQNWEGDNEVIVAAAPLGSSRQSEHHYRFLRELHHGKSLDKEQTTCLLCLHLSI